MSHTHRLADRFINEKSPGFEAVRSLIMKDQEIVDEEDEETSEAGK